MSCVPIIDDSPWSFYKKIYGLRLGEDDIVTVAERKGISCDVVAIRRFSGAGTDKQIEMVRLIQHKNFITAHEIYKFDEAYYVIFEHMPLSLQEVAANPYLNQPKLAAIMGQVGHSQHRDSHAANHNR